ncbi:2618_t:CDS:1, partial [Gigaspora rosea]
MSGSINRDNQGANNFCDPFSHHNYDFQSLQYFQDLGNLQALQELENFEYNKGNQNYNNPEDTYYHSCIQLFQDLYNLGGHHKIQEPRDQFQNIQYSEVLDSVNSPYVQDHNQDAYDTSHVQFFYNNDINNYHIQEPHNYDLDVLPSDSNNEVVYNEAVDLCEMSNIEFQED